MEVFLLRPKFHGRWLVEGVRNNNDGKLVPMNGLRENTADDDDEWSLRTMTTSANNLFAGGRAEWNGCVYYYGNFGLNKVPKLCWTNRDWLIFQITNFEKVTCDINMWPRKAGLFTVKQSNHSHVKQKLLAHITTLTSLWTLRCLLRTVREKCVSKRSSMLSINNLLVLC